MKNNRIYRLDEDRLELKPINSIIKLFLNNPLILCGIIFFCIICCCAKYWQIETKHSYQVEQMNAKIKVLETQLEMEAEIDSLHIRIAEATLEGHRRIPFNDSVVYEYIKSCNAWYPEIIMAQFKLESGGGVSEIARQANNFFGMRPVSGGRKNYTTQRHGDSYKGYAVYDNWKLSVIDKVLWEHFRFGGVKPERQEYIRSHMDYAEAEGYISRIEQIGSVYKNK